LRRAYAFERLDDDHPAAATRASARRRRCFGLAVGLSVALWGETLGGGEQLAGALDVVRSNRSSEQAVVMMWTASPERHQVRRRDRW
jgi:hypothetical protein